MSKEFLAPKLQFHFMHIVSGAAELNIYKIEALKQYQFFPTWFCGQEIMLPAGLYSLEGSTSESRPCWLLAAALCITKSLTCSIHITPPLLHCSLSLFLLYFKPYTFSMILIKIKTYLNDSA